MPGRAKDRVRRVRGAHGSYREGPKPYIAGRKSAYSVRYKGEGQRAVSGVRLPARVAAAFGVEREAAAHFGTEGRTYRSGDVVLRHRQGTTGLRWTTGVLHVVSHPGVQPGQGRYAFLTQLCAFTHAPIVICSASPALQCADYHMRGFAAYLEEPFDLAELITLLASLCPLPAEQGRPTDRALVTALQETA